MSGKRAIVLPVSLDPTFVDLLLGRPVVSSEMAKKAQALEGVKPPGRLINLTELIAEKPYYSSPNFLREKEAYYRALDRFRDDLDRRYGALLIVGGSGALLDLANSFRVHDLLLAFYQVGKPVAVEYYGISCLAFARDENERRSTIAGKHVTDQCIEYDYTRTTGFARTDLVTAGPAVPLEYILRDATVPGGQYHGNFGRKTSVVVDYPFVTERTTGDSYLTGKKLIEVLENRL